MTKRYIWSSLGMMERQGQTDIPAYINEEDFIRLEKENEILESKFSAAQRLIRKFQAKYREARDR